jgi:hypothetical protein
MKPKGCSREGGAKFSEPAAGPLSYRLTWRDASGKTASTVAIAQARRDRRAHLKTGGLQLRDHHLHGFFIGFRGGLLQSFGRLRNAPRSNPAGGAFEGVRRGCRTAGFCARDALQNEAVLVRENLQDLPFEATVAERHSPEMIFVKSRQLLLRAGQDRWSRCSHDVLTDDLRF